MAISDHREQREMEKFVNVGTGEAYTQKSDEVGERNLLFGITEAGTSMPIKINDDGSGLGKLATTM